jgi:hypothetical protein
VDIIFTTCHFPGLCVRKVSVVHIEDNSSSNIYFKWALHDLPRFKVAKHFLDSFNARLSLAQPFSKIWLSTALEFPPDTELANLAKPHESAV